MGSLAPGANALPSNRKSPQGGRRRSSLSAEEHSRISAANNTVTGIVTTTSEDGQIGHAQGVDEESAEEKDVELPPQPHTPGLIPPTPRSPLLVDGQIPSPRTARAGTTLYQVSITGQASSSLKQQQHRSGKDMSTTASLDASTPERARIGDKNLLTPPLPRLVKSGSPRPSSQDQYFESHSQRSLQRSVQSNVNSLSPSLSGRLAVQRPESFHPYFTLIANVEEEDIEAPGGKAANVDDTVHHPVHVHYLFEDDEDAEERLADACLRIAEQRERREQPADDAELGSRKDVTRRVSREKMGAEVVQSIHEDGNEDEKERVVVIDVNETGEQVVKAVSLSADWQVMSAKISSAPIWDQESSPNAGSDEDKDPKPMMLRIEGIAALRTSVVNLENAQRSKNANKNVQLDEEEMQKLLDGFDRKMRVLRRIVDDADIDTDAAVTEKEVGEALQA